MKSSRAPPGRPLPRALLFMLVMAVGIGAASALLTARLPPSAPTPPSGGGYPVGGYSFSLTIVSVVVLGILFGWVGWRIYLRLKLGGLEHPQVFAAAMGLFILILALFVVIVRLFVPIPGASPPGTPPPNNTTSPASGTPPAPSPPPVALPGGPITEWVGTWWLYLLLAAIVLVGAFVLYPMARARDEEPEEESKPASDSGAEEAVRVALRALETDPNADPRAVIIALYARLLARIGVALGDLSTFTAREIRRATVTELGVSRATAHALTELFEEARYSTHPIDRPAVERTRSALATALEEIDRRKQRRTPLTAGPFPRERLPEPRGAPSTDGEG